MCFQLRDVNREHTLHGQLRMLLILLKSARWRGMGLGVHFVRDEWGGRAASKAAARRYDALEATLLGTGELRHVPVSYGRPTPLATCPHRNTTCCPRLGRSRCSHAFVRHSSIRTL